MTAAALAFAAGAALLQVQASLPSLGWGGIVVLLLIFSLKYRIFIVPLAFAAGFFWAAACAHWRMADRLAGAHRCGRQPLAGAAAQRGGGLSGRAVVAA